jgi:hypothetical protein
MLMYVLKLVLDFALGVMISINDVILSVFMEILKYTALSPTTVNGPMYALMIKSYVVFWGITGAILLASFLWGLWNIQRYHLSGIGVQDDVRQLLGRLVNAVLLILFGYLMVQALLMVNNSIVESVGAFINQNLLSAVTGRTLIASVSSAKTTPMAFSVGSTISTTVVTFIESFVLDFFVEIVVLLMAIFIIWAILVWLGRQIELIFWMALWSPTAALSLADPRQKYFEYVKNQLVGVIFTQALMALGIYLVLVIHSTLNVSALGAQGMSAFVAGLVNWGLVAAGFWLVTRIPRFWQEVQGHSSSGGHEMAAIAGGYMLGRMGSAVMGMTKGGQKLGGWMDHRKALNNNALWSTDANYAAQQSHTRVLNAQSRQIAATSGFYAGATGAEMAAQAAENAAWAKQAAQSPTQARVADPRQFGGGFHSDGSFPPPGGPGGGPSGTGGGGSVQAGGTRGGFGNSAVYTGANASPTGSGSPAATAANLGTTAFAWDTPPGLANDALGSAIASATVATGGAGAAWLSGAGRFSPHNPQAVSYPNTPGGPGAFIVPGGPQPAPGSEALPTTATTWAASPVMGPATAFNPRNPGNPAAPTTLFNPQGPADFWTQGGAGALRSTGLPYLPLPTSAQNLTGNVPAGLATDGLLSAIAGAGIAAGAAGLAASHVRSTWHAGANASPTGSSAFSAPQSLPTSSAAVSPPMMMGPMTPFSPRNPYQSPAPMTLFNPQGPNFPTANFTNLQPSASALPYLPPPASIQQAPAWTMPADAQTQSFIGEQQQQIGQFANDIMLPTLLAAQKSSVPAPVRQDLTRQYFAHTQAAAAPESTAQFMAEQLGYVQSQTVTTPQGSRIVYQGRPDLMMADPQAPARWNQYLTQGVAPAIDATWASTHLDPAAAQYATAMAPQHIVQMPAGVMTDAAAAAPVAGDALLTEGLLLGDRPVTLIDPRTTVGQETPTVYNTLEDAQVVSANTRVQSAKVRYAGVKDPAVVQEVARTAPESRPLVEGRTHRTNDPPGVTVSDRPVLIGKKGYSRVRGYEKPPGKPPQEAAAAAVNDAATDPAAQKPVYMPHSVWKFY